jgi:hypothetical protein
MKLIADPRRTARNLVLSLTGLAALFALVCGIVGYNPFDSTNTIATPTTTRTLQLNRGGLPIGDPWVDQVMNGNVSFQQTMAGTNPDYPVGPPMMVIFSVAKTDDVCNIGTAIASYAGVNGPEFDKIAGCHTLNDALNSNDHIGCYNAAAAMYNDLSAALIKGAPRSLTAYDVNILKSNLDSNFNGITVAEACGLRMDPTDTRAFRPVALIA